MRSLQEDVDEIESQQILQPDFAQVDEELEAVLKDLPHKSLKDAENHPGDVEVDYQENNQSYDYSDEYICNNAPIDHLDIRLGTDSIPRFCCACHKLNLAVRKAIKDTTTLSRSLAILNKFSANIRKSYNDHRIFLEKKNRLRCEGCTRWSAAYLMLQCFYRAYLKGCFDRELKCPVSKDEIEMYLIILLPVYRLNITFQKNSARIGDVVPHLLLVINAYKKSFTHNKQTVKNILCKNLAFRLEEKFKFELSSPIYAVASLFNTSKLGMISLLFALQLVRN